MANNLKGVNINGSTRGFVASELSDALEAELDAKYDEAGAADAVEELIPTALSQLSSDVTHRTVTDAEKTAWNNKQDEIPANTYDSYGAADAAKTEANAYTDGEINDLQGQIDALVSKSDVVDVIGTYTELQSYDTSSLLSNDVIKVLSDSTHSDSRSYYRWIITSGTGAWSYVGSESVGYTKSETDALLNDKQDIIPANTYDAYGAAATVQTDLNSVKAKTPEYDEHIADADIHVTAAEKTAWNGKSDFSGSYNDLANKPTIPSALADLESDSTHRTVTDTEKTAWSAKYAKPSSGIPSSDMSTAVQTSLGKADNSVQQETGKGLSSNDYTTAEKNKLAGIAAGAEVNVNADWNATSGDAQILNKPSIPTALSALSSDASHRTVSDAEKTAWSAKYSKPSSGIPAADLSSEIQTALTAAGTAVQPAALDGKVDKISGKGLSTNDYTSAEKTKLSGIAAGAEVNQNAFANVKVGSTTVSADAKQDTIELVAGTNISLTPDASNDKITISASGSNNVVTSGTPTSETLIKVNLNATPQRMPEILHGTAVTGTGVGISATVPNAQAGDVYINTATGYYYISRLSNNAIVWDFMYTTTGANDMISAIWSGSKTYYAGDYCIYTNKLWKCKVQHSGQTPTEGTYWTSVTVSDELKNDSPTTIALDDSGGYFHATRASGTGFNLQISLPRRPVSVSGQGLGYYNGGSWGSITIGSWRYVGTTLFIFFAGSPANAGIYGLHGTLTLTY